jgi:hypothetical protein
MGHPLLNGQTVGKIKYDEELEKITGTEYRKLESKYLNNNWNKRVLDFAYAFVFSSMDSNYKNVKINKHSFWGTYGDRLWNWGQFLIGVNYGYGKDSLSSKYRSNGAITGRLYGGVNFYKIFLEGSASMKESERPLYVINSGGEFRLLKNIWLNIKAGFGYDVKGKQVTYNSNFSFKWGFSGMKSLYE